MSDRAAVPVAGAKRGGECEGPRRGGRGAQEGKGELQALERHTQQYGAALRERRSLPEMERIENKEILTPKEFGQNLDKNSF